VHEDEDAHVLSGTLTDPRTQPGEMGGRLGGVQRSPLDFERLDVYCRAIDFLALVARITAHMPRGHVLLRFGAVSSDDVEQGKTLLSRVVAMLSNMCRR
jgi:hypothetical protein